MSTIFNCRAKYNLRSLPPLKLNVIYYIPPSELFDESEKFGEISETFQRKVDPRF